jgi:hypothetical protein
MKRLPFVLAFASLTACAVEAVEEDGREDSFVEDGKADTGGISPGSIEALGVLRVANEQSAIALREHGVGKNAAENIVAGRVGADDEIDTADDVEYVTLAQLDAVPFVGPIAFARLLAFAEELGYLANPSGPSPTAPSDVWTLSSCTTIQRTQLLSKFAAGSTRVVFDRSFEVRTRSRSSCNDFTGCSPWKEHTEFPLSPAVTMKDMTGTENDANLQTNNGEIYLRFGMWLGAVGEESVSFECRAWNQTNRDDMHDLACTGAFFRNGSKASMHFPTEPSFVVPGRLCADGTFHFLSTLGEAENWKPSKLSQFAFYGRLF